MKKSLYLLSLLFFLITLSCKTTQQAKATEEVQDLVHLICQLTGEVEGKTLNLYQFDGLGFNVVQAVTPDPNKHFNFKVPAKGQHQFYYLGTDLRNRITILLGTEAKVVLTGKVDRINGAKMKGSDINIKHEEMKGTLQKFKNSTNQLMRSYQKSAKIPEKAKAYAKQLDKLDIEKRAFLDSLSMADPFLSKVAGMSTYLSYPNNKGAYPHEVAYFISEYFKFVNLADAELNNIPPLFEQFRSYTQTLSKVGLGENTLKTSIEAQLAKVPQQNYSHRFALGGVVSALMQSSHPLFVSFGESYLTLYGTESTPQVDNLKYKIKALKSLMLGAEAPDFTLNTPEGETLSLSALRGKVVMIDFWASWCGPCRRENPNVVRLYNQYKDRGFEILGVSLDRTKQPWLKAIEKDGLEWFHVSDLKGWKSAAAQMYNVSSIPQTLLLDENGNIIARNLRGQQLAQRLAEIFSD